MGNRRHHKKQRAEIRARMARTGETYQQALERLRGRSRSSDPRVDLVRIDWFGGEATLATIESMGMTSCFIVSAPRAWLPFPLRAPRVIH